VFILNDTRQLRFCHVLCWLSILSCRSPKRVGIFCVSLCCPSNPSAPQRALSNWPGCRCFSSLLIPGCDWPISVTWCRCKPATSLPSHFSPDRGSMVLCDVGNKLTSTWLWAPKSRFSINYESLWKLKFSYIPNIYELPKYSFCGSVWLGVCIRLPSRTESFVHCMQQKSSA
jgi:hypothetical protein